MRPVAFFDFDSTLVSKESLDTVIAYALEDTPDKDHIVATIESITNRGMNGEIPFTESARLRLATLPLHRSHFEHVGTLLTEHITPGMPELFLWLTTRGVDTYIISGGFYESVSPTATLLRVPAERVYTNRCTYDNTGMVQGPDKTSLLWTDKGKDPVIRNILSRYEHSVSALVGDGANDLAAYAQGAVDHFCGFGAHVVRPKVQNEAPHFARTTDAVHTWLAKVFNI